MWCLFDVNEIVHNHLIILIICHFKVINIRQLLFIYEPFARIGSNQRPLDTDRLKLDISAEAFRIASIQYLCVEFHRWHEITKIFFVCMSYAIRPFFFLDNHHTYHDKQNSSGNLVHSLIIAMLWCHAKK